MALRDHLLTIGIVVTVVVAALIAGAFIVGYNELLPLDRPLVEEDSSGAFPKDDSGQERSIFGVGLGDSTKTKVIHAQLLQELDAYCLRLLETLTTHLPHIGDGSPYYELLLNQLWGCKSAMLEARASTKQDPELERAIRRIDVDYELVLTFEPTRDQQALRLSLMADWVRRKRRQMNAGVAK